MYKSSSYTPHEAPEVLRRIEHAARNTAAAPFCRRSSLEWPCKIWILLLSIGRLCCIFGVCWGVLVTILGALGAHFGSQNRSFWVPGGPLAPWKTEFRKKAEKEVKKEAPGYRTTSILGTIFGPFFNDFLVDFSVRFLDHFWSHVGPILGAKMGPKSIKHRCKIQSKFQSDFGVLLGSFFMKFESILEALDPQKWCSRVGAVLFLRKSRFSDQIRLWIDFWTIFNGFG